MTTVGGCKQRLVELIIVFYCNGNWNLHDAKILCKHEKLKQYSVETVSCCKDKAVRESESDMTGLHLEELSDVDILFLLASTFIVEVLNREDSNNTVNK